MNAVCELLCDAVWLLFFVLLCLCVLSLHVIMRFVFGLLCDYVCSVCVIMCSSFVQTVRAFCLWLIAMLCGL